MAALTLSVAVASAGSALAFDGDGGSVCLNAGAAAERSFGLPTGMLVAIGRVESGRRHPVTGQVAPWPWTINAAGTGRYFDNAADAIGATRQLRVQGVQSIDVGCFQISLLHHPAAFATLEEGFDPKINAEYAARFLLSLKARAGSWEEAIASYHSATPERGGPYRDRVLAGWRGNPVTASGGSRVSASAVAVTNPVRANPLMVWSPSTGGSMRIWGPSASGTAPSIISIRNGGGAMQLASNGPAADPPGSGHGWTGCAGPGSTATALRKC